MKTVLLKFYYAIILLSAKLPHKQPTLWEKMQYLGKVVMALGPVAAALDAFGLWVQNNSNFFVVVLVAVLLNMIVGVWYHLTMNTFKWVSFIKRNSEMFFVLFVVYILLEMMRYAVGSNIVGEGFKVLIQVTTLLYPISKTLKNIYILTGKKYPPEFIMERLYNFEKNGDLKELFNDKNTTDGTANTTTDN